MTSRNPSSTSHRHALRIVCRLRSLAHGLDREALDQRRQPAHLEFIFDPLFGHIFEREFTWLFCRRGHPVAAAAAELHFLDLVALGLHKAAVAPDAAKALGEIPDRARGGSGDQEDRHGAGLTARRPSINAVMCRLMRRGVRGVAWSEVRR